MLAPRDNSSAGPADPLAHWAPVDSPLPDPGDASDAAAAEVRISDALRDRVDALAHAAGVEPEAVYGLCFLVLNRLYRGDARNHLAGDSGVELAVDFEAGSSALDALRAPAEKALGPACSLLRQADSERESGEEMALELQRDGVLRLVLADTARRYRAPLVADNLAAIVERIARDPETPLARQARVSRAQREWLARLNQTGQSVPDATIAALFEQQVRRAPQEVALVLDGAELSYRELNERANRIAHFLIGQGVGGEDKVVIYADRGFDCLAAILAVMKSGAAFVPVDPVFTSERTDYIIRDSQASVVLTQAHLAPRLADGDLPVYALDAMADALASMSTRNPEIEVAVDALAYILYTSGSTGRPKGVLVEHRGVTNLVWAMAEAWGVDAGTRYLQFASMSFDASVPEWATTLTRGGRVIFKPARALGLDEQLVDLLQRERVSIIKMPAAALTVLPWRSLPDLKVIITAGDACNQALVRRWAEDRHFFNCYGPTEMSIGTSMYPCHVDDDHPCIGRPNFNTRIHILDDQLNPVPIGRVGEMYLTGVGVARGYHRQPALTARQFLANPFDDEGARLYRSGDLGYYRADGMIEFCGRADDQVKIRGYRVELGEIERVLKSHASVEEACVAVDRGGESTERLVAYFVAGAELDRDELASWTADRLPDYMTPSVFKRLEAFALSDNGKIDRAKLPSIDADDMLGEFEAPDSDLERDIAELWRQELSLPRVGRNDHFFRLGGTSLSAAKICTALGRRLERSVPTIALLGHPVLREFAGEVDDFRSSAPDVPVRDDREAFPASSAQQRLYFMQALQPKNPFYNITLALRLRGRIDAGRMADAFRKLVQRHESLRTRFEQRGEEILQQPVEQYPALEIDDASALDEAALRERLQTHGKTLFRLDRGVLCDARLFRLGEEDTVLSIVVHHIAADGPAIQVLFDDLMALYYEQSPAPVRHQAVEHALWEEAGRASLEAERRYWKNQFNPPPAPLRLCDPRAPGTRASYRGDHLAFSIGSGPVAAARAEAREQSSSVFTLVLARFARMLARYSDQSDLAIGVPMAPELPEGFERSVGLFADTLPIRIRHADRDDSSDLVRHVGEQVTGAIANQRLPLQDIVRGVEFEPDAGHNELFQVLFGYQQVAYRVPDEHDLQLEPVHVANGTAKYALTLLLDDFGDSMQCRLEYDSGLISPEFARTLADGVVAILDGREPVSEARGRETGPLESMLDAIWDHPDDSIALRWDDRKLARAAMRERVDALAAALTARDVRPGDRVALNIARDNPLLVLLELACLRIGAAILALNPKYPRARVEYMLENARPALLVTDAAASFDLPTWAVEGVDIESFEADEFDPPPVSLDDVAYVVYTSGTTGQPKGIELRHRTLANLIQWQRREFGDLGITDVAQFSAIGFDVAMQEMLYALADGCCYHLTDAEFSLDFNRVSEFAQQHPGAAAFMPTALFHQYADHLARHDQACRFRAIAVAGEALRLQPDAARALAANPDFHLFNQYGPAETHVVTAAEVDLDDPAGVHIGRPVDNTWIRLLDEQRQPVAPGRQGELYIGGAALAKGYVDDARLTDARFVQIDGRRLYATGDLVRMRSDGALDYIGRNDNQVKIRGFRVEPEEVSARLERLDGVNQAAVVARRDDGGEPVLAAWVRLETQGSSPNLEAIRETLAEQLPDYMVPVEWCEVERFPTTSHGKVDHARLPSPNWRAADAEAESDGRETVLEQVMAELWKEILGRSATGGDSHFFRLGGHSLKLMQLASQIQELLELDVAIGGLMERPRLADQCRWLESVAAKAGRSLERELLEDA